MCSISQVWESLQDLFSIFYGSIFTYLDLDINSNAEHCPLQTDPDACYCH